MSVTIDRDSPKTYNAPRFVASLIRLKVFL